VFVNKKAEPALLLPPVMPPGMPDQSNCSVLVWQSNSSEPADVYRTVSDHAYIDSIVEGRDVSERYLDNEMSQPPDNITISGLPTAEGECQDYSPTGINNNDGQPMECGQLKVWCNTPNLGQAIQRVCPISCGVCTTPGGWEPCYPHNCADGGGPWVVKGSDGLVNIPFYFEANVDTGRKASTAYP